MEYSEPKEGDSNNDYPSSFKKDIGGEKADGMGLLADKGGLNDFAGSESGEQDELAKRERARFEELRGKAFGRNTPITNAGIPLDSFGGSFAEASGEKGGSEGEQKGN